MAAAPQINTYHCLCTSLLLASTHSFLSLPRRASPSLDSAIIVPLRSPPKPPLEAAEDDEDGDAAGSSTTKPAPAADPGDPDLGYTLLLGTTLDVRPAIIRRADGFEKRYLLRCERCRLVVGYELDASHFTGLESTAMDVDGDGETRGEKWHRTKIAYILPGGVVSTEAMAAGKKVNERDVTLGESERKTVAAWE